MNVLLKKIWLELIHLSLAFSIGSWTCGHTLPLLVPRATTNASFNPFAPEPPVTARADPGPFYPL